MNQSMSNGGDCRTAPATPGLLIIKSFWYPLSGVVFKRAAQVRMILNTLVQTIVITHFISVTSYFCL